MAELILTDEEKAAAFYSDWDATAIGVLVKALAQDLQNRKQGEREILIDQAAAFSLIARASQVNATEMTVTQNGVTNGGEPIGDWEVIVRRIK